jgi:hypothetical protein
MDVSDASYYIQENTKIKVAEWGTPKNIKKTKKKQKTKKKKQVAIKVLYNIR